MAVAVGVRLTGRKEGVSVTVGNDGTLVGVGVNVETAVGLRVGLRRIVAEWVGLPVGDLVGEWLGEIDHVKVAEGTI
ncbi:MAG: hypothetical protein N3C12_13530 [Candidatus Binatia bacterium]|nr:hypothetical protein [Candidatus Binatia bacterium]